MGWLLVLFPEDIYCLIRWTRISVCIPSMDGFLATYWSYTAYFYLFHLGPLGSSLLFPSHPEGWGCLSPSALLWAPWSSKVGGRCLGESCDSCLGENSLFSHCPSVNRTQLVSQKEQESVALLRDTGDLMTKDMRKVQKVDAFFASDHWQSPLLGLPNTCGWQQHLVEWGTTCSQSSSDYEPDLWTGKIKSNECSLASDAPEGAAQSYCGRALCPFQSGDQWNGESSGELPVSQTNENP